VSAQTHLNAFYRYILIGTVVVLLVGVGFAFMPKVTQFQSYQATKTDLDTQLAREEERIKELRSNQERFHTDKQFVQQIAHDIGFAHEDETIFQFSDSAETNIQNRSGSTTRQP
jgi:cell division protein FtsB